MLLMRTNKRMRRAWSWAAGAALLLTLHSAHANVAAPLRYEITVDGNTARICWTFGGGLCDANQKSPLVRKDVATGATVVVPLHCDERQCFVDECVPAGSYQWGLAEPGKCVGTSRVDYWGEARVTEPLAAACAPELGPERPTPFMGGLPWTADNVACRGGYCGACVVGSSDGADRGLAALIALLAGGLALGARRRQSIVRS